MPQILLYSLTFQPCPHLIVYVSCFVASLNLQPPLQLGAAFVWMDGKSAMGRIWPCIRRRALNFWAAIVL